MHAAVLRYAREVAFATAEVYARAAEVRGAWDARLEALVVDAVLRAEADEARALPGQRARLGRAAATSPSCSARSPAAAHRDRPLRRGTPGGPRRGHGRAVRGPGRAAGGAAGRRRATRARPPRRSSSSSARARWWSARWPTTSPRAHVSARAALSAYRAAAGWPEAPAPGAQRRAARPSAPSAGDGHARRHLVDEVYLPLLRRPRHPDRDADGVLRRTARRSRAPRGRCSCTPTPCATGCARSPT